MSRCIKSLLGGRRHKHSRRCGRAAAGAHTVPFFPPATTLFHVCAARPDQTTRSNL